MLSNESHLSLKTFALLLMRLQFEYLFNVNKKSSLDIHPILSGLKPEFITTIKYLYVHGDLGERAIIVSSNDKVFTLKRNYRRKVCLLHV